MTCPELSVKFTCCHIVLQTEAFGCLRRGVCLWCSRLPPSLELHEEATSVASLLKSLQMEVSGLKLLPCTVFLNPHAPNPQQPKKKYLERLDRAAGWLRWVRL